MKMSVMRFDGLQGQPFWMQNDQLANSSSQFCLKSSARVESDRRKTQRPLNALNEDPLGPSRITQMDDNVFSNDSINADVKGTKSGDGGGSKRKSSSDSFSQRKLARISALNEENKYSDLASSEEEEGAGDESKSEFEEEDEGYEMGRTLTRSDAPRCSDAEINICDNAKGHADDELDAVANNKDYNSLDDEEEDDDVMVKSGERCQEASGRNNGEELAMDEDYNDYDEVEGDCHSVRVDKDANSDDDSNSLNDRNDATDNQNGSENERKSVERQNSSNSLGKLSQGNEGKLELSASSSESRRNKRKNFKPRNIVYQYDMGEEADNEMIDDYQMALSRWEQQQKSQSPAPNDGEESAIQKTISESHRSTPTDDGEVENARGDFDQPLDLSDNTLLLESSKVEAMKKNQSRGKGNRRYREVKRTGSSLLATGSPMDLTMMGNRAEEDKAAATLCKNSSVRHLGDAMDLSTGHFSSTPNARPNYATSLTTVPVPSASRSSPPGNANSDNDEDSSPNNGAADFLCANQLGNRASSSTLLPKITPQLTRTGISASLLELVNSGNSSSSSKRNAKAAAAAAAAHAAALGLAKAVKDRDGGFGDAAGMGLLGPAGHLGALPPNVDVASMKDYAESTMKELLGLYGFNDMESLTKDVAMPNFLSADMLESMSNTLGLLPSQASLLPSLLPRSLPQSSRGQSSPLSFPGKSSLTSGRSGKKITSTSTPSPSENVPSTSQVNEDMYDSLHSQMIGNMAKMASLPAGNMVGNPRGILPPDMNTILRLAAMQKSKQNDVPLSTPSPTLPSVSAPKSSASNSSSRARSSPTGHSGIFQDQRKSTSLDYSRYVKRYVKMRLLRFSSAAECGNNSCKNMNYREHFHCLDCNSRVFIKKEEMIRHFKWHKKRDESLQHGFLRYSPMDDCSDKFSNCAHNRKQTHYHCLMYKEGCDKCYISTSDVQMHANYHRKDSAIIQEGFQRYRATEDCGLSICAFSGQRTTHFHCRRTGCNYTFKNKADMEKHKTYHIKDEQLNKDGFKKFMKHEICNFENCRFSRVCNHIHCIRPNCNYVLHSSGQLYSHKRKHERRDNEMAYRKFKLAQSMMKSIGDNQGFSVGDEMKHGDSLPPQASSPGPSACSPSSSSGLPNSGLPSASFNVENAYNDAFNQSLSKYSALLESGGNLPMDSPPMVPYGMVPGADPFSILEMSAEFLKSRSDDSWRKYLNRFTANDPCKTNCELIYKDHYHCNAENCSYITKSKDGVREHARNHELQDQVTEAFYATADGGLPGQCPADCPIQSKQRHYHCGWQNCRETILAVDKPFRRLDHYKMHEYSHKLSFSKEPVPLNITSCSSIDGIFRRKRGRPPKNRTVEFPVNSGNAEYPQAIYTSFKLPKLNHMQVPMSSEGMTSPFGNKASSPTPMPLKTSSPGVGQLSPNANHPSKAFPKLSHLQLHIPKHLGPATSSSEAAKGTPVDDYSDGEFSDRPMEEDEDDGDIDMNSRHQQDSSDESNSSSNRFNANYLRSSPSADSTPSSHNQSYGPFMSNAGALNHHLANDLLHTFPNVAEHLQMNPLANFFNQAGGNVPAAFQDLRAHHNQSNQFSNGSNHNMEMNAGEHSSPVSTPPGSGGPSSVESYGSNPNSPNNQFPNQKHFLVGGVSHMDGNATPNTSREDSCDNKKLKAVGLRLSRDEPVPEGYIRYRFNEDCRYEHCGYREHQTHFHCMRKDCGYSFCDKTRFVQHTARHERLDTLMGGDFQQFRAQVACGRSDCLYITAPGHLANKASHFHCLKCDFVCTDTNKVVAHRRQHQKLDSITAAGFEKYAAQQSCNIEGCSHNQRQTHYHCVKCQYAVMGLSQMNAHKYRHLEG